MRITLILDDQLLISARHRPVEEEISLVRVIGNALRKFLEKPRAKRKTISLITASGAGVSRNPLNLSIIAPR